MKKASVLVFGIVACLLAFQIESLACSCDLPLPKRSLKTQVTKARNASREVFSGKVLEINKLPDNFSVTVKFKVDSSWKGSLPEEITISTGIGGGDCGYHFEVGETYLVYAFGSTAAKLSTNICQRTSILLGAAGDLKILGKGKTVKKNQS